MLAQDPEGRFRFSTRLQAVRDAPWTDWEGQTFLPVRSQHIQPDSCVL